MWIVRIVAVYTLSAGLLQIAATPARADDAQLLQEVRDRAAIEALMWRYVRALDTLDADAYAAVFTPDGKFGSGQNAEQGRAELKAMVERDYGREPTLESVFMTFTGKSLDDDVEEETTENDDE